MIKFDVETIPHNQQRYDTVGDYSTDVFRTIHFKISDMNNYKYEILVTVHEIIEKYLCYYHGVSEGDIDNFDMDYEKKRKPNDFSEPGDSRKAPYNKEHLFATKIEKLFAEELNVDWRKYDKTVSSL